MAEAKPGVYAYATGYIKGPTLKSTNGKEIGKADLVIPGYRDADPDEVYKIIGWGAMAHEVGRLPDRALVKVTGYLRQKAWQTRSDSGLDVEISARKVEVLDAPAPLEEEFEDADIPF